MPTEISQLRPEGVQAAVEFAGSVGCQLDPKTVNPQVSLIVKDGDTLTAVVLGVHSPGGACELHVCLEQVDDSHKLTAELLNKALMKVHGAGVRRCQISHHGHDNQPVGWSGAKWTGEPEAQSETPVESQPTAPGAPAETDSKADAVAGALPETAIASEPAAAPEAEAA
jgi:hypothetical protein